MFSPTALRGWPSRDADLTTGSERRLSRRLIARFRFHVRIAFLFFRPQPMGCSPCACKVRSRPIFPPGEFRRRVGEAPTSLFRRNRATAPRTLFVSRMMISETKHTVAIVGGGLAGALVALQLLRRARAGIRVTLIERGARLGRGLAYGTESPVHLLNVPAGRMSSFPDQPEHFLKWAKERLAWPGFPEPVTANDYLPRQLFGRYIGSMLEEAQENVGPDVEFEAVRGEVLDIEEMEGGGGRLILADGRSFEAQGVVLALGNLPGAYPIPRPLAFYRGPRYVHVPWNPGALNDIPLDADVLLIGAGLTATDIIVQLEQLGHRGVVHAVSRRGLRAEAHKPGLRPYPPFLDDAALPSSAREALRRVRAEVRRAAERGIDWRPVIDALRPQTQAIWAGWSPAERARFMRHLRPYWEACRHRIAPGIAARVQRLEEQGRVKYYAGRMISLKDEAGTASATFRLLRGKDLVTLAVAKVINCTGPRTDYSKYQHPLLVNLLARGLIDHDPLALGLNARPTGEVLRYRAGPSGWLFTLGAPLKGVLWETTAVPEIRDQAVALAERLLAQATPVESVLAGG